MEQLRTILLFSSVILVVDIAISVAFFAYSNTSLPQWDRQCREPSFLIVFYGGRNPSTIRRVDVAQQLLKECASLKAILVGGSRPDSSFWGSEWMKAELVHDGIEGSRLITERRSYDSRGNIREMLTLMNAHKAKRAILVSDSPHLYRLLHIANKMRKDNDIKFETASVYPLDDRLAYIWRPHYEAIAWLALLLPVNFYDQILRQFRR